VPCAASTPPAPPTPTPPSPHNNCPGEPCEQSTQCRSKWGSCGTGSAWCNIGSTWKWGGCSTAAPPTTPAPTPGTPAPTTAAPCIAHCVDKQPPSYWHNPTCASQLTNTPNCAARQDGTLNDGYCALTCGVCSPCP
jgi:hypothetical protein